MAEHTEVMTGDAIYTDKGMKLVDKGTRVDSRLYDRLVMHKLRDPIDANLITGDLVDVASLVALARQLCEQVDLLQRGRIAVELANMFEGKLHNSLCSFL